MDSSRDNLSILFLKSVFRRLIDCIEKRTYLIHTYMATNSRFKEGLTNKLVKKNNKQFSFVTIKRHTCTMSITIIQKLFTAQTFHFGINSLSLKLN